MASCTNRRDPAQQTCPWLNQIASTTPSIALSRSASSKTTNGDFPPSSSVKDLPDPAVFSLINFPTSVDPVNAILLISLWLTIISPTLPSPVTILIRPFGTPADTHSSANKRAVKDVYSAGFSTTALPIAMAGAIFHESIRSGKFHGII